MLQTLFYSHTKRFYSFRSIILTYRNVPCDPASHKLKQLHINIIHDSTYTTISRTSQMNQSNLKRWLKKDSDAVKKHKSTTSSEDEDFFSDKNFGFGKRKPLDEEGFQDFLSNIKQKKAAHAKSILDYPFNDRRARCMNGIAVKERGGYRGVCFWMFRDQRVDDNWALIYAQKLALQNKCPLYVTFFLMSHYSEAGTRQYYFMLKGLQLVEKQCQKLGIQFHLELGYAKDLIGEYCERNQIDFVVADFMPLRDVLHWVEEAGRKLKKLNIPLYQVDAHNVVPVWHCYPKAAFGARIIRPVIEGHKREFLTEFPTINKHPFHPEEPTEPVNWDDAWAHLNIDTTVKPVAWAKPGTLEGIKMVYEFISQRLLQYDEERNLPTKHALSCLSPYFHFGQLSTQRAIIEILAVGKGSSKYKKQVDAWVEEALVRRELSDNFCFYTPEYDNFEGAADWAKLTHSVHKKDKREFIYTQEELQFAKTHDKCWNAAQIQMVQEGKMHGYLRMYWAKKILEWTPDVHEAIRIGIFLNDKYMLDGRDPNGYVGIMWSMVGTHDRGWTERPIFGKIRYMNYNGCARKFDVEGYARIYRSLK